MPNCLGVGTDLVEIDRFRAALERREGLASRMFSHEEQQYAATFADPAPRLAARFAAKEAVMKALGVGLGAFGLQDVEVVRAESGAPAIALRGRAAELARDRGIRDWQLSLSHSESMAIAVAIAVGDPEPIVGT